MSGFGERSVRFENKTFRSGRFQGEKCEKFEVGVSLISHIDMFLTYNVREMCILLSPTGPASLTIPVTHVVWHA